jgi:[acyl-carrier-protein] S-malonyltransferase
MTDALDLVARRAEIMDSATPPGDGMLFVRGLSRDAVDGLCKRHDTAIAIINPGDAFLLGGSRMALDAMSREAKAINAARVVDVPVEMAATCARSVGTIQPIAVVR